MWFGVCSTVIIQEIAVMTQGQGLLGVSMYSQGLWCLWDMGKYGLAGCEQSLWCTDLNLLWFLDKVSLVLAVAGLGLMESPPFSLSSVEITDWSHHVQVSFRF